MEVRRRGRPGRGNFNLCDGCRTSYLVLAALGLDSAGASLATAKEKVGSFVALSRTWLGSSSWPVSFSSKSPSLRGAKVGRLQAPTGRELGDWSGWK